MIKKYAYESATSEEAFTGAISYELSQLIKIIFSISVFHKVSSNKARPLYIKIANSFNTANALWYKAFKDHDDFKNYLVNKKNKIFYGIYKYWQK